MKKRKIKKNRFQHLFHSADTTSKALSTDDSQEIFPLKVKTQPQANTTQSHAGRDIASTSVSIGTYQVIHQTAQSLTNDELKGTPHVFKAKKIEVAHSKKVNLRIISQPILPPPQPSGQARFAIGNSSFRVVVRQKNLMVDKTLFIKEILDNEAQVKLIIRPRRFGKTFNLSMLECFLDNTLKEEANKLFHPLKIWSVNEGNYQQHQGRYPVISLTFKDIKQNTFEEALEKFKTEIAKIWTREHKKHGFKCTKSIKKLMEEKASEHLLKFSIEMLISCLYELYQSPVILLLDEYDAPLHTAYLNTPVEMLELKDSYYQKMVAFMRDLFAPLKDNSHLYRAVLTGILRVSKESIFSGLNNVTVYSVLRRDFSEHFGFSEHEVREQLQKVFGAQVDQNQTILQDLESHYGGYRIGPHILFNPWAIANFIEARRAIGIMNVIDFEDYWINTSGNDLVKVLLKKNAIVRADIEKLLKNESVVRAVGEHTVFSDLAQDTEALWSLLLLTGYLTAYLVSSANSTYALAIPNQELYKFYTSQIKIWYQGQEFHIPGFQNQRSIVKTPDKRKYRELLSNEKTSPKSKLASAHTLINSGYVDNVVIKTLIQNIVEPYVVDRELAKKLFENDTVLKWLKEHPENHATIINKLNTALNDPDSYIRLAAIHVSTQLASIGITDPSEEQTKIISPSILKNKKSFLTQLEEISMRKNKKLKKSSGQHVRESERDVQQSMDASKHTRAEEEVKDVPPPKRAKKKSQRKKKKEKNQTISGRQLFQRFVNEGYSWTQLREFGEKIESEKDIPTEEVMSQLVQYRDVLDCELYREAAKALFPNDKFTIQSSPEFEEDQDKIFRYYVLKIYREADQGFNDPSDEPCCTITIKAPGSRNLTSDIDTTLSVSGTENLKLSDEDDLLPRDEDEGEAEDQDLSQYQTDLLVQALMIEKFNHLSETKPEYGTRTSALNRDSNVYGDGFLRKEPLGYPKFLENPLVNGNWLFGTNEQRIHFYAKFKREKHQLEMGASLVYLRESISATEWDTFKKEVIAQIDDFGIESTELVHDDFSTIFEKAENLYEYKQTQIQTKLEQLPEDIEASKEESKVLDLEKKNHRISAINSLYVAHLKELTKIENRLEQVLKSLDGLVHSLEEKEKALRATEQELQKPHGNNKKELRQKKRKKEIAHNSAKNELEKALKDQARLKNEKQELQIKANLFAYEAYVSRSGPYHVVENLQSGGEIKLTKQTVMGSALEQIGFKLEHSKHMREEGASEAEITYKTAKYGQRVAHLLFGQLKESYDPDTLKQIPRGGKTSSLTILSALEGKNKFEGYFTPEEYQLLNRELRIVKEVKSNAAISENEKTEKTAAILAEYDPFSQELKDGEGDEQEKQEQAQWLKIGAKILAAGYKARLEKKPGLLWGAEIPQTNSSGMHEVKAESLPASSSSLPQPTALKRSKPHKKRISAKTTDLQSPVGANMASSEGPDLYAVNIGDATGVARTFGSTATRKAVSLSMGLKTSGQAQLAVLDGLFGSRSSVSKHASKVAPATHLIAQDQPISSEAEEALSSGEESAISVSP